MTTQQAVFYTVEELAQRWKCQRRYIYKLIEARVLIATRLGPRFYRIKVDDMERCEQENRLTS